MQTTDKIKSLKKLTERSSTNSNWRYRYKKPQKKKFNCLKLVPGLIIGNWNKTKRQTMSTKINTSKRYFMTNKIRWSKLYETRNLKLELNKEQHPRSRTILWGLLLKTQQWLFCQLRLSFPTLPITSCENSKCFIIFENKKGKNVKFSPFELNLSNSFL